MFSFSFFPVDCTLCCCAGDGGKNCKKKPAKSHPYQMEVDAHQMEVDAYQMEVKGADNCCVRAVLTWPLAPKRHPQGASVASSRQNDGYDLIAQFIFETHVTKNRV